MIPATDDLILSALDHILRARTAVAEAHGALCEQSLLAAAALLPLVKQLAEAETLARQLASDAEHHEQMMEARQ